MLPTTSYHTNLPLRMDKRSTVHSKSKNAMSEVLNSAARLSESRREFIRTKSQNCCRNQRCPLDTCRRPFNQSTLTLSRYPPSLHLIRNFGLVDANFELTCLVTFLAALVLLAEVDLTSMTRVRVSLSSELVGNAGDGPSSTFFVRAPAEADGGAFFLVVK